MWYTPLRRTHLSVYTQAESAQGDPFYEAIERVIETQSFMVNYFIPMSIFIHISLSSSNRAKKNKLIL